MHRLAFVLGLLVVAGCGPLGPIPGGRLSGEPAPAVPESWDGTDDIENVQLETRPSDPYSVNVWGVGIGSGFYVVAGDGEDSTWAGYLVEDPNVRLRVGDALYELRAVRVEDEPSREKFLAALKRKYDYEPDADDAAKAWLFRLEPR